MSFVVIRHPEAGIGTAPELALEQLRANGWQRVSEPVDDPREFGDLAGYADAPDLDAEPEVEPDQPDPEPPAKAAKSKSKE